MIKTISHHTMGVGSASTCTHWLHRSSWSAHASLLFFCFSETPYYFQLSSINHWYIKFKSLLNYKSFVFQIFSSYISTSSSSLPPFLSLPLFSHFSHLSTTASFMEQWVFPDVCQRRCWWARRWCFFVSSSPCWDTLSGVTPSTLEPPTLISSLPPKLLVLVLLLVVASVL